MRKVVWLLGVLAVGTTIFGCNSKECNQDSKGSTAAQKTTLPAKVHDKDLALKYLKGIQNCDKHAMYEATNLTEAIVNESREKLVYQSKYNLTDQQRKDFEKSLRISGEIDHILLKLRGNFPKSASFRIQESKPLTSSATSRSSSYSVQTTYSKMDVALRDKTGKPVKEMVLKVDHISMMANDRLIHEFAFNIDDIIVNSYF